MLYNISPSPHLLALLSVNYITEMLRIDNSNEYQDTPNQYYALILGHVAQSVAHLTLESVVPGSIPGLALSFLFPRIMFIIIIIIIIIIIVLIITFVISNNNDNNGLSP